MKRCINLSSGVYLFIVVLTGVASSAVSFENVDAQNKHSCRGDEECVLILDCEKYQSATSVRRHKPEPCGFNGKVPKVCCSKRVTFNTTHKPDTTNEPLTELFHVLPSECGDPIRTIFNVPGPTPPPGSGIAAGFGGRPAERGKWPWMVLLGRWSESGRLGDWFCGGTLITDRHLLTAAHCLSQQQMGSVGARLGEHDLTTTQDVVHQERHIVSVRRHRQYRGAQNDIAVVRLDRPVSESQYVRPICLPAAGSEHDGRDVEMAGFGYLEFAGALPDVLQEVPLRVSDVQIEMGFKGDSVDALRHELGSIQSYLEDTASEQSSVIDIQSSVRKCLNLLQNCDTIRCISKEESSSIKAVMLELLSDISNPKETNLLAAMSVALLLHNQDNGANEYLSLLNNPQDGTEAPSSKQLYRRQILLQGLCGCGRTELFESIIDGEPLALQVFPVIEQLCRAPFNLYQSFHLLERYLSQLLGCAPLACDRRVCAAVLEPTQLLLAAAWERQCDGLPELVTRCWAALLSLLEVTQPERQYLTLLLSRLSALPWTNKAKLHTLYVVGEHVGPEELVRLVPELTSQLPRALSGHHLAAVATDVYRQLTATGDARGQLSRQMAGLLLSKSSQVRQTATLRWLPALLRAEPTSAPVLLSLLCSSQRLEATSADSGDSSASTEEGVGRSTSSPPPGIRLGDGVTVTLEDTERVLTNDDSVECGDMTSEDEQPEDVVWAARLAVVRLQLETGVMTTLPDATSETLVAGLTHRESAVRIAAIGACCGGKQLTRAPPAAVCGPLLEAVVSLLDADSTALRYQLRAHLRKLVPRLRSEASHCVTTGAGSSRGPPQHLVVMLRSLVDSAVEGISPASHFQRRATCLGVLEDVLSSVYPSSVTSQRKPGVPPQTARLLDWLMRHRPGGVTWEFLSPPACRSLVLCLYDEVDDIREGALSLLLRYFVPGRVLAEEEVPRLLDWGDRLARSAQFHHTETAAALYRLGYELSIGGAPQSDQATAFVSRLLSEAVAEVEDARHDLYTAALKTPVHGRLACLRRCLLPWCGSGLPGVTHILSDVVALADDVTDLMLTSLAGQQLDDDACPSFAELGSAVEGVVAAAEGQTQVQPTTELSQQYQLVLSCCWLSLKESCSLLGDLVTSSLSAGGPGMEEALLRRAAATLNRVLDGCRHKGAIEAARAAWTRMSAAALRCRWPALRSVPGDILRQTVTRLRGGGGRRSATRRGAGLPMLFQATLSAGRQPHLVSEVVASLLELASEPLPFSARESESEDLCQTTALHVLHRLLSDAAVSAQMTSSICDVTCAALRGLTAPAWAVRNASLLLFGAAVPRLAGQTKSRDVSSVHNRQPLSELLARWPQLVQPLLAALCDVTSVGRTPTVAALTLLSRVTAAGSDDSAALDKIRAAVVPLLGSAAHTVRRLAAGCLAELLTPAQLRHQLTIDGSTGANLQHGRLMLATLVCHRLPATAAHLWLQPGARSVCPTIYLQTMLLGQKLVRGYSEWFTQRFGNLSTAAARTETVGDCVEDVDEGYGAEVMGRVVHGMRSLARLSVLGGGATPDLPGLHLLQQHCILRLAHAADWSALSQLLRERPGLTDCVEAALSQCGTVPDLLSDVLVGRAVELLEQGDCGGRLSAALLLVSRHPDSVRRLLQHLPDLQHTLQTSGRLLPALTALAAAAADHQLLRTACAGVRHLSATRQPPELRRQAASALLPLWRAVAATDDDDLQVAAVDLVAAGAVMLQDDESGIRRTVAAWADEVLASHQPGPHGRLTSTEHTISQLLQLLPAAAGSELALQLLTPRPSALLRVRAAVSPGYLFQSGPDSGRTELLRLARACRPLLAPGAALQLAAQAAEAAELLERLDHVGDLTSALTSAGVYDALASLRVVLSGEVCCAEVRLPLARLDWLLRTLWETGWPAGPQL